MRLKFLNSLSAMVFSFLSLRGVFIVHDCFICLFILLKNPYAYLFLH